MEQQLRKLRQHVLIASSSSSSSPAAMAGVVDGVARVYEEHAEPLARSAARAGLRCVEEELEASVALLDACAAARDALVAMRARAVAAEAATRRRDGAAADAAASAYALLARAARADARRRRRRAGGSSSSEPEEEGGGGEHALREARRLTFAVLERVVAALSRRRVPAPVAGGGARRRRSPAAASTSSWSTRVVATVLRRTARVACEDDAGDMISAGSLSCKDLHEHDGGEAAALRELRALVDTIGQLEDGLELLFRRLVQCRVCLLNTCSF